MNPEESIQYPKSQYKKFIKDVVEGTMERSELIEETLKKYLNDDLDLKKTDKLLKVIKKNIIIPAVGNIQNLYCFLFLRLK